MKTIRINRAKWLRGSVGSSYNSLWCSERQAGCCLGHAIHQTAKCSWNDLRDLTTPPLYYSKPSFLTKLGPDGFTSNDFADEAMNINDTNAISEEQREKRLIKLFAENNIKLEFYN
jgi:hypothetical protein